MITVNQNTQSQNKDRLRAERLEATVRHTVERVKNIQPGGEML